MTERITLFARRGRNALVISRLAGGQQPLEQGVGIRMPEVDMPLQPSLGASSPNPARRKGVALLLALLSGQGAQGRGGEARLV